MAVRPRYALRIASQAGTTIWAYPSVHLAFESAPMAKINNTRVRVGPPYRRPDPDHHHSVQADAGALLRRNAVYAALLLSECQHPIDRVGGAAKQPAVQPLAYERRALQPFVPL